ncbi:MAG: flavodoxin domain-containing protein [Lentihominibacter sp.]|nr:flavodoxin domain-containing protein [Lentihominibacter sp.]
MIIIYKSKTGFTKKYAELIAAETGAEVQPVEKADIKSLAAHDVVVFGGRCCGGVVDGLDDFRKQAVKNGISNLMVFCTGATPAEMTDMIGEMWKNNLSEEDMKKIPHYYLESGICYEKMNFADKMMMKAFRHMMKKKTDKTQYEEALAKAIEQSYDNSSPENARPLIEELMQYRTSEDS